MPEMICKFINIQKKKGACGNEESAKTTQNSNKLGKGVKPAKVT